LDPRGGGGSQTGTPLSGRGRAGLADGALAGDAADVRGAEFGATGRGGPDPGCPVYAAAPFARPFGAAAGAAAVGAAADGRGAKPGFG
jgi:hypothetical protein